MNELPVRTRGHPEQGNVCTHSSIYPGRNLTNSVGTGAKFSRVRPTQHPTAHAFLCQQVDPRFVDNRLHEHCTHADVKTVFLCIMIARVLWTVMIKFTQFCASNEFSCQLINTPRNSSQQPSIVATYFRGILQFVVWLSEETKRCYRQTDRSTA